MEKKVKKNIYRFSVDYYTGDYYVVAENASAAIEMVLDSFKEKLLNSSNICLMERVAEGVIY